MQRNLLILGACLLQAAPLMAAEFRPTDPAAPAPPAAYLPGFEGYKPFREEAIADWRGLNNEVKDIGGHAGIFGGAGHGGNAPSKPAAQPVGPTPPARGQAPVRGAPEAPAGTPHH
jgi:hypothetical protein